MNRIEKYSYYIALTLLVYMPLHVFVVQSASLVTGGIDVWKASKDVLLALLVPALLYVAYKRRLHQDQLVRRLLVFGGLYGLIHMFYVVFDGSDDTFSAVAGSVFNLRLLGYLLLGYVTGTVFGAKKLLRTAMTVAILIAFSVAAFGVAQYFLPADFLELFGYAKDRGVPPLFFIDDDPNLPRVMSTLKDPNSLGAYLLLPLLATGWAAISDRVNKELFMRPFRRYVLMLMASTMFFALVLTFSRGALISSAVASIVLFAIVQQHSIKQVMKKAGVGILIVLVALGALGYTQRDSAFVQDYVLHAAESDSVQDPNELRVSLQSEAINRVVDEPLGHGPGTAGLVSISNPQGGFLTENYYLQIAYEVGWLGVALFMTILVLLAKQLIELSSKNPTTTLLLASLAGYTLHSLLIHLWSNEAVALQWWLLVGAAMAITTQRTKHNKD